MIIRSDALTRTPTARGSTFKSFRKETTPKIANIKTKAIMVRHPEAAQR